MKVDFKFAVALIACAAVGGELIEHSFVPAAAQSPSLRQRLVGTWTYVHNYNVMPDGKRIEPQGPQGIGKGIFVVDANGRFVWNIIRSDIPKFGSNNRQNGTDAENKATVQGVLAYFGTYEVDESNKSLIMRIEYSSFPNFNGAEQRRTVKIENDELTVINSGAASGGTANVIWKRVK
jgi:lipocalin-like protein